ncbi:MAG: hypothetical protein H0V88_10580 [Pyrinomonadaceae bacterium]|nr:hypothetical protein [Pyrinomonadaceae bacterium]
MTNEGLKIFMENLLPMSVSVGFLILVGWVIATTVSALRHKMNVRAQTELHNRLLEKFGSASEFTAYLQTPNGERFFDNLATERVHPASKILGSIQKGSILSIVGLALLLLSVVYRRVDEGFFLIFGVLVLALGAGFLISSALSYRLSKAWGLMTDSDARERRKLAASESLSS